MKLLVTVGTTSFDNWVYKMIDKDVWNLFLKLGFKELHLQIGNSDEEFNIPSNKSLNIKIHKYINNFEEFLNSMDLIITHCGAGIILNCLKLNRKFISVVNNSLMDNHQKELADGIKLNNFGPVIYNINSIEIEELEILFNNLVESKYFKYQRNVNNILNKLI